jgi:hypothetical protein
LELGGAHMSGRGGAFYCSLNLIRRLFRSSNVIKTLPTLIGGSKTEFFIVSTEIGQQNRLARERL